MVNWDSVFSYSTVKIVEVRVHSGGDWRRLTARAADQGQAARPAALPVHERHSALRHWLHAGAPKALFAHAKAGRHRPPLAARARHASAAVGARLLRNRRGRRGAARQLFAQTAAVSLLGCAARRLSGARAAGDVHLDARQLVHGDAAPRRRPAVQRRNARARLQVRARRRL